MADTAVRQRGDRGPGAPWPRRHPVVTALTVVVVTLASIWGIKLARLGTSVDDNRAYWSQPRGEAGGLLYVALGDSAAQSIGASRPERGYVGLLADRMRAQTGRPVQVVNLSASGDTVSDVLRRQLPLLRELRPDVVTVAIGGNDVRSYDADRFLREVDELTAALPAGSFVADVPYYMHGRYEERAHAAAQVVTESARARGLAVVPLHQAQRDRGTRAMATDFAADWFHPNDRGHRVWADAMWEQVRRSPALT